MYLEFYGLKRKPFPTAGEPDCFYPSPSHRTALRYLEYALVNQLGFVVITGEIGSGKTTLVRRLLQEVGQQVRAVLLEQAPADGRELLQMVLRGLGASYGAQEGRPDLLARLRDRLRRAPRTVIIVDEAQRLSDGMLEEVRMLSNLQEGRGLQIVLVGQPSLRQRLARPSLEQLRQRVALNYHLGPLGRQETIDYVRYRLEWAGAREEVFEAEALEAVFEHSGGIPRRVNLICDAALVYGFADGLRPVPARVVREVVRDLYPPEPATAGVAPEPGPRGAGLEGRVVELLERIASALERLAERG